MLHTKKELFPDAKIVKHVHFNMEGKAFMLYICGDFLDTPDSTKTTRKISNI